MIQRKISLLAAALILSSAAQADTAYVKPSTFKARADQTISVEVAFNDVCCEPRYAVRTDTYAILNPDGSLSSPDRIESFATTTILEHTLTQEGTSRITTGERLGRKGEYVRVNGQYHLVNSPDAAPVDIPPGTPILSSQTATVSDAYVTVGAADWKAVRSPHGRLSLQPALHPNKVTVGLPFTARVTFDGAPVKNQTVLITSEASRLSAAGETIIRTNEKGVFTHVFDAPGIALLMVRLQADAPDGAETDIRSYTTSLTLDVRRN